MSHKSLMYFEASIPARPAPGRPSPRRKEPAMFRWFAGAQQGFWPTLLCNSIDFRDGIYPWFMPIYFYDIIDFIRVTRICALFSRLRYCRTGTAAPALPHGIDKAQRVGGPKESTRFI